MERMNSQVFAPVEQGGKRPLIVQVVRQYAPGRGGLEDVVANLSRLLLQRGYRVRVVTCNSLFTARDRLLPPLETIDGVEVVRIPWWGSPRYPVGPTVLRHIGDADLVHVHGVDFFFDFLAATRFLHGKAMVVTTHGGFFHTPKYTAIKKVWFRTLTRFSAHAYRALLCCSRSDFALFSQIAGRRAVLVENGVDTEKFAGLSSSEPQRRIVTIGRFSVNKRLDRMLDMMAALVRLSPDWRLDIIGSPSDLNEEDLRREIAARGLSGQVFLHVSVGNDEVRRLIAEASIFASASEYEGFGLVAVEAMSAGLLPILHPNEAYQTLAAQHDAITLADFRDANSAADALIAAYGKLVSGNSTLKERLIDAARLYSWDAVAERYISVYNASLKVR